MHAGNLLSSSRVVGQHCGACRRRRSRSSISTKPGSHQQKLGQVSFDDVVRSRTGALISTAPSRCCTRSGSAPRRRRSRAIAEKDPSCGIAWWGVAMSRLGQPVRAGPSGRPRSRKGGTAIAKARRGRRKNRPRAWPDRSRRGAVHGLRNGRPADAHGQLRARHAAP